ncbi:energy transducer TonB [Acidaminococcus massiliensis]|uniref:energy transducer TonB n=1 Tax=Acidaminococcus massiliensis TaxID=1852375 RepID=UPI00266B6CC6|nr:energy transducer TonB [Acidaminococcus massiliensis]
MEICDSSKGLLVSLGAHLIFFLLVGAAGYQAYQKQQAQDPIYTVEIVSGSPYHGYGDVPGAHLGNGNPPAPAAAQQQAAPQERASAPVMQPAPQDVIPDGQVAEDRPMAAASSVSSAATGAAARPGMAAQGDPEGGSPGEPPGPAGGDGPGFDTEAVQSDVSASFLGGPDPEYPSALQNHGIQGSVRVRMIVGKDGTVESASVISGSGYGQMDQAALDAAYGYQFEPAYKEGYPVRCYATKTFTFRLN